MFLAGTNMQMSVKETQAEMCSVNTKLFNNFRPQRKPFKSERSFLTSVNILVEASYSRYDGHVFY